MSRQVLLEKIAQTLQEFKAGSLEENALKLFETLGYRSHRRIEGLRLTAENLAETFSSPQNLRADKALSEDWQAVHLLFQLTDDEISAASRERQLHMIFDSASKVDPAIYSSYLFFALALKRATYTRGQLAAITREINRLFPIPGMVLFQHGETLTLAIIHRRPHRREAEIDVLEKVTLIKDIRTANPHRAHLEILADLCLEELYEKQRFTNFLEMHEAWKKTLDISELNKRFFKELANWYFWAVKTVKFPVGAGAEEDTRNAVSVIRLITRLIFVWFIKEKEFIPEDLFDKNRLDEIINYFDPNQSTYYKAILQNLFFATLNTEMGDKREFRRENAKGRDSDYLMSIFYRYKRYFKEPDEALQLFAGIPFLNGGLFECLDKEEEQDGVSKTKRIDGFSDREDNPLKVPDELFFGSEHEIDLNEVYGTKNKRYKVRGLIHTFNSYKFTIEENTPIEEEVALDPELLGKVFENLLAAFNPETGTTARKQTGSFYTPREIVNYMVDEALVAYLENNLTPQPLPRNLGTSPSLTGKGEKGDRLRALLAYHDEPHGFSDEEVTRLIEEIDRIKVLDPACGSGAFPMGVLHKLVYLLGKLDQHNERWKEKQIAKASEIPDAVAREAAIQSIEQVFENNYDDYGRKLYLIENCIYGVDIQPIAVQIAKLRFFISLVVEQKVDPRKYNLGISTLPNLETKFVAANTLIGIQRPNNKTQTEAPTSLSSDVEESCNLLVRKLEQYLQSRSHDLRTKYIVEAKEIAATINTALHERADFQPLPVDWIFTTAKDTSVLKALLPVKREEKTTTLRLRNREIEDKERELERVRREHFSARTPVTKRKYRDLDKKLRHEIADLLSKNHALEDDTAQKLAGWDPYDQNSSADFFDPEWMFGVAEGFDITIGNPPYVRADSGDMHLEFRKAIGNSGDYETLWEKWDLYIPFIEKSYKLLKLGGFTTLIVSDAYSHSKYAQKSQIWFLQQSRILRLDFLSKLKIFDAEVRNITYLFQKASGIHNMPLRRIHDPEFGSVRLLPSAEQSQLTYRVFFPEDTAVQRISVPTLRLEEICYISVGMVVHADEKIAQGAFVLNDLMADRQDDLHPKPFVKGKHLDRWLPITYKWLEWGTKRAPTLFRRPTFFEMYNVEEKLLILRIVGNETRVCYDDKKLLCNHTIMVCVPWHNLSGVRNNSLKKSTRYHDEKPPRPDLPNREALEEISHHFYIKYLLAVMNSGAASRFLKGIRRSNTDIYPDDWKQLPIPDVPLDQQAPISDLVEEILIAKHADSTNDVSTLEAEIDRLVYELYGLTDEEIALVEGGR